MRKFLVCAAAAAALLTAPASAQFLVVPDSLGDTIMSFDPFDGSLINQTFIVDAGGTPYDFGTPKDAILVGNEIWVSDQISDAIFRFDLSGSYLSTISGGLDNIRGMAYANGTVYVSNSGTNNGAPGDALVRYAPDGTFLGSNPVGDPFDVLDLGDSIAVSNIAGDDIDRFDYNVNFIETIVNSDGASSIDFPQQLALNGVGNILAAGFSAPAGIYEFDLEGNTINYYADTAERGVYELGNGNLLFTDGSGVHILDPSNGNVTTVVSGVSGQYINLVPEPASLLLLALGAGTLIRRR